MKNETRYLFIVIYCATVINLLTINARTEAYYNELFKTNVYWNYNVKSLAFSPDSGRLVVAYGSTSGYLWEWDVTNRTLWNKHEVCDPWFECVVYSPDGRYVAASFTSSFQGDVYSLVRVYDTTKNYDLCEHVIQSSGISSLDFSKDGRIIAFCYSQDYCKQIRFLYFRGPYFDGYNYTYSLTWTNTYKLEYAPNSVKYSPNGQYLAYSTEIGTVGVLDASNVTNLLKVNEFTNHLDVAFSVVFSPDGTLIASCGYDGKIVVRKFPSGDIQWVVSNDCPVYDLRFSPDGKILLAYDIDSTDYLNTLQSLKFWRVSDGRLLLKHNCDVPISAIDIAPNGSYFAYALNGRTSDIIVATLPVWIEDIKLEDNNTNVVLSLCGGNGVYQVQACSNLISNDWQNAGLPTTNKTIKVPAAKTTYYRVISLPLTNNTANP
ncbi:MAG: WD40 repeat domain-containing protein [Verrucomicrobiia bacterium]